MGDIFEEVDEEVRRERLARLWQKYGKFAVAALVLIIGGTAATVGWREYAAKRQRDFSDRFVAALDQARNGKQEEALAALEALAADAPSGYEMVARFRLAALRAATGDGEGAAEVYDALAEDTSLDPVYRDLAVLLAVMQRIDTGDTAALERRLTPLLTEEGAWRYTAREVAALLALRRGDRNKARDEYTRLADDLDAPQATRARAAEMIRALGR